MTMQTGKTSTRRTTRTTRSALVSTHPNVRTYQTASQAVQANKDKYMRLESASTFKIATTLLKRLDVYIIAAAGGFVIGLLI